jgi:8-oxo-dGTP pyrophosphatase MutT (NUDIX family)
VTRLLLSVPLVLLALSGCGLGSSDAGGGDDTDDRTAALECLQEAGLDARLEGKEGDEEIVIGDSPNPPRIKFFLTAGESEAEQFQGRGEGAEQIGEALLYVGNGSDDELREVEECLADL